MKNADRPAFNAEVSHLDGKIIEYQTGNTTAMYPGLTKREYFAAMAMQGLCANSVPGEHHMPKNLVSEALEYADELLKKLEP